MRTQLLRSLTLTAVALFVALSPSPLALAHNSLASSDPVDGAVVDLPLESVTWNFENPVPLDSMTVTLIGSDGSRTQLSGLTHGLGGDTQVVTPLPDVEPGEVNLRWRLVGSDGHPITGRLSFEVRRSADDERSLEPTSSTPVEPLNADAAAVERDVDVVDDASSGVGRWALRYASYAAIFSAVGLLGVSTLIWPAALNVGPVRASVAGSLFATAVLAFAQLLVIASDITGDSAIASLGSLGGATSTVAGMSLVVRIAMAATLALVVFSMRIGDREVRTATIGLTVSALLGTWAFSGHAQSMRWPIVGVMSDVSHHGAAAVWVTGLGAIVVLLPRFVDSGEAIRVLRRFSRTAALCVTVIVLTGVIQAVRLVGGPGELLGTTHGRLLIGKALLVLVMLGIANDNRRRVHARLLDGPHELTMARLRRSVLIEFALGVIVLGVTAALVVSTPGVADGGDASGPQSPSMISYRV